LPSSVKKLISGGQTGADRAALDFARSAGFGIGGFIPLGRRAEDGIIPNEYSPLVETDSADPSVRTRLNVAHSDATIILTHGPLSGGSKLTYDAALEMGKPVLHIDLRQNMDESASAARAWLATGDNRTINIAGPRLSEDPLIYDEVIDLLKRVFA
jgi:hypothetical protein